MIRSLLARLYYRVVVLSIGMMACLGLMGAGWLIYWLIYALWGPG